METRAAMAAAAAAADKTGSAAESVVGVDVFLMNDQKVTVRGKSILQTDEVLEVRIASEKGVRNFQIIRVHKKPLIKYMNVR